MEKKQKINPEEGSLEDIEVKDAEEIKIVEEGATLEEQAKYTNWEEYSEEDEKRMDIIGQNGNDGEHYSELDLNKDGKIDQSELKIAKDKLQHLQNSISGVTKSSNRVDKALKEIRNLEALIASLEDDLTIKY